jgi:hypothetical protein
MCRYIQRISIDNRDWWVGWEIDNATGEIPGLILADHMGEAELRERGITEFRKVNSNLLQKVERRRASRFRLEPGLPGLVGREQILVRDISNGGLGIRHRFPLALGKIIVVAFEFQGQSYSFQLEVLRCTFDRQPSASDLGLPHYSALRLAEPNEEDQLTLRDIARNIAASLGGNHRAPRLPLLR